MLHTLRGVLANDSLWFALIRGIAEEFRYKTITTEDVIGFVNRMTGTDYTYFFDQYLRYPALPKLEAFLLVKKGVVSCRYRWRADVKDFHMPVRVTTSPGTFAFIHPTPQWQTLDLGTMDPKQFRCDDDWFYIDTQFRTMYQASE
jgi:aminopeptidase N